MTTLLFWVLFCVRYGQSQWMRWDVGPANQQFKLGQTALAGEPYACWFTYDTTDQSAMGSYTTECSQHTGSPCDCTQETVALFDESYLFDKLGVLNLTDTSVLDFTVDFYRGDGGPVRFDTYFLTALEVGWLNGLPQRPPNLINSYVALYDADSRQWRNIAIRYDDTDEASDAGIFNKIYAVNSALAAQDGGLWIGDFLASQARVHLEWDQPTADGLIQVFYFGMQGTLGTQRPTVDPTTSPSNLPTTDPTTEPTLSPTMDPTRDPTTDPTWAPTRAPTYYSVTEMTQRVLEGPNADSYQYSSDNVIPLTDRATDMNRTNWYLPNQTRSDGTVRFGGDRVYNLAAILAWGDIDAKIELEGCPTVDHDGQPLWDWEDSSPENPDSFYYCDTGTWVFTTTGRLADFQDTYCKLEVWEQGDNGLDWLLWEFEFNWWNDTCFFVSEADPDVFDECNILPLSGTDEDAVQFSFSMPKRWGDARKAPLIVKWLDLLGVGYELQPPLNFTYYNITLMEPAVGRGYSVNEAWAQFEEAVISAIVLACCFVAMMILSCFLGADRKKRREFMIDTRNLKTTFRHTPATIIVPPTEIKNRSRFSCARHGPWLMVVFVGRLIYKFVFTLTFFYFIFVAINAAHYATLAEYNAFAANRNDQIVQLSYMIEAYYANESARVEAVLQQRIQDCSVEFKNQTAMHWVESSKRQIDYHNEQLENPFGDINFNLSSLTDILVFGDGQTACNTNVGEGAIIYVNSQTAPLADRFTYTVISNLTVNQTNNLTTISIETEVSNITTIYGSDYRTDWANFSQLENILTDYCEQQSWCSGWGFWDDGQYYILFSEMADPAVDPDGAAGVCFGVSSLSFDLSFLEFNASSFTNYADGLNAEYLADFQSYTESLYSTVNGLWGAIQDFQTGDGVLNMSTRVIQEPDSGYDVDATIGDSRLDFSSSSLALSLTAYLDVQCPDCPSGNFTEQYLDVANELLYNRSNISEYGGTLLGNISSLVSFNEDLLPGLPELPTIDFPFSITLPEIPFAITFGVVTFDLLLFIYRWYITVGIIAAIIRGRDVDVSLRYLMVAESSSVMCHGRNCVDYCLNCVLYCNDCVKRMSYHLWKLFFWIGQLLILVIIGLLIFMAYILADAILTEEFFLGLGVFDLMTLGVGAQRQTRNQVLSTTVAGYNGYTLVNLANDGEAYTNERNQDAFQQNIFELERIDQWNAVFCRGWGAYHGAPRNVMSESKSSPQRWINLNGSALTEQDRSEAVLVNQGTYFIYDTTDALGIAAETTIDNLFDDSDDTYWTPYPNALFDSTFPTGHEVTFDLYLSPITMTETVSTGWDITQITLDWRFVYDDQVTPNNVAQRNEFQIFFYNEAISLWQEISYPNGNYYESTVLNGERQSVDSFSLVTSVPTEVNTRRVRIQLNGVETWGTETKLNGIEIYGHAPESEVVCPQARFRFWEYSASLSANPNTEAYVDDNGADINVLRDTGGTHIPTCPTITPIHGIMYRGFVRRWVTQALIDGHRPFILALRNIALSPFYIVSIMILILFLAKLFTFVMEWFLQKLDLFRENPYCRVPLVTTNFKDYDPTTHETGPENDDPNEMVYGEATVGKNYYRAESMADSNAKLLSSVSPRDTKERHEIEMGLSEAAPNLTQRKEKAADAMKEEGDGHAGTTTTSYQPPNPHEEEEDDDEEEYYA